MELKINIENKKDIVLLITAINTIQSMAISRDVERVYKAKNTAVESMVHDWSMETQEEWYGLQKMKAQLETQLNN